MGSFDVGRRSPYFHGNEGLDVILKGGLPANRLYLVEGEPGSGKTTLGLEFLRQGVAASERVLYITLSETAEELRGVAASHGWDLDKIDLFELSSAEEVLGLDRQQSVLHPREVELGGAIRLIQAEVERVVPKRVVLVSVSEMRLLAQDPLRYRRQVLALKQYFATRACTVMMVDDLTGNDGGRDSHLHSLCHGVVTLERLTLEFGAARRRLQVQKLRGVEFTAGYHDMEIRRGRLQVFPRLITAEHHTPFVGEPTPSGVAELDALLSGGPLRGACTLLTGPAGSGKSTIALQYLVAACQRGESAFLFEFDERVGTLMVRAQAMNLDLQPHIDSGLLVIHQVDPAQVSPGEFAAILRDEVERRNVRMVAAVPQSAHETLSTILAVVYPNVFYWLS